MLAISPLKPTTKDGREQGDMVDITSFSFLDFSEFAAPAGCLLDTIDFDDLIRDDDVLPELGMDPTDFMAGDLYSDDSDTANQVVPNCYEKANNEGDECKNSVPEASKDEEIESESEKSMVSNRVSKKLSAKKSNSNNKNDSQGKRKTKKVDWTPDLHRRFVQAVEQLGVDKAVPSRILELMGIHCLTRHNVASHLQKYRSHRKHLLAREAEAASWSQKRQMYGVAVAPAGGGSGGKSKVINHQWHLPTIGFPPMTPPPIHHPFRPLHVWGHPTTHHVEHQSVMPVWPKQLVPSPSPAWPSPPPVDPSSFWHPHHQHRFAAAPLVPGIPPPHATMSKPQQSHAPAPNHPPLDLHPTKESIDAVIGDVLSKPWLPLPIGLKPPSVDSVMVELQRQGIPKIPPSACS